MADSAAPLAALLLRAQTPAAPPAPAAILLSPVLWQARAIGCRSLALASVRYHQMLWRISREHRAAAHARDNSVMFPYFSTSASVSALSPVSALSAPQQHNSSTSRTASTCSRSG